MNKLIALTVWCALACAGFGASAQTATLDATDDGSSDLTDALDYGMLVDTVVDEDGVAWETYYDEVTNVLWTQTAGAPKDAALDSIEAGGEFVEADATMAESSMSTASAKGGVGIDSICAFVWTYPYSMTIWDDLSHNVTLYSDSAGYVGYCDDDPQCRLYYYDNDSCSPPELLNTCGWIESVVRTSSATDYSSSYYAEYKDLDSAGMWNPDVDDQHISVAGGYRYYYMHEAVDVACEAEWDYGDGFNNFVKVAEHWFYACGASHRVQTAYGITAC